MRIDVQTEITDYDGNPISTGDSANPNSDTLKLGNMIITALNTPLESDKDLSAEKKVHRAVISQDVHNAMRAENGVIDIPHEDIVEIKGLLNHFYAPLPMMRAFDIFDPKVAEVSKAD